MLSLHHGFYPKVTSRDTTVSGCLAEAGIPPRRVRRIIMAVRSYPIRVGGNSGDFKSKEIDWKRIANRSGVEENEIKGTEKGSTTGNERRVGEFSWSLFRQACDLNSPTDIAFTFADYIHVSNQSAIRFEQLTLETRKMIEELERCSGVRVNLIGTGFDYRAIIDRRNWR
jgi:adenylosuccinate synthase